MENVIRAIKEFGRIRSEHKERIFWIGCNIEDKEIWKKQSKEIEEEVIRFTKKLKKWIEKHGKKKS